MSNLPVPVVVPGRNVLALMDAAVVLPHRSLNRLLAELHSGGFYGLRFGPADPNRNPGYRGSGLARRASPLLALATGTVLMLAGPSLLGLRYAPGWVLLTLLVPALLAGCLIQGYYGQCRAHGRLGASTAVAVVAAGRRPFMLTR